MSGSVKDQNQENDMTRKRTPVSGEIVIVSDKTEEMTCR